MVGALGALKSYINNRRPFVFVGSTIVSVSNLDKIRSDTKHLGIVDSLLSASIKPNESSCVVFNGFAFHVGIIIYFSASCNYFDLIFYGAIAYSVTRWFSTSYGGGAGPSS